MKKKQKSYDTCMYSIHHDLKYYPNSNIFDPESFIKEKNNDLAVLFYH